MHCRRVARGIDQRAALRFGGGDGAKPVAQALVEAAVEALETIGGAAARGGAAQPGFDRQVEDQRQVGDEIAEREALQRRKRGQRQAAAVTLIGGRRIGEAIADDPGAGREGGTDGAGDMVAPGGAEQQRLAGGIPALAVAFEQQAADRLGAGRTTRLAGGERGAAGLPQRRDQERRLGRFPGPLAALDGDEFAARGQWRLPQIR